MSGLSLCVLGPHSAALDGRPLGAFRTRLAEALLIYLACEPEPHRRELLTTLFWPGLPQASAQQNLRQNLYLLRRAAPEVASAGGATPVPLVLADNDTLRLNPAAAVTVDARRFAALIDRIRPGLGELEEAVALYRGDFLADFYLPDSNPFEAWAAARREAYRRGALLALERLVAIHLADEDFVAAEGYARRQLAIDPLHETGNRQLIEILARGGRRCAALAHFDDYRRLLNEELGVKPGSETLALVSAVQGEELLPAARRPDHIRGYDIHEELGRGSYGVVFRASQPAIGRDVAVKVIPARYADDIAFIRRFEAEAQTIARLEHPQIVPLYDYWREPGSAYLVMRYLRGGNLRAALGQPWDAGRVARLLDQVAAALAVAHRHGVVHRDVKPANILLDEDGNAYLTDFGIARLLRPEGATALSREMFAGTPEYVSPEQALNEDVTPLSDQYSLGLVAYEALSGRPPFVAGSLLELLEKHAREPAPPLHARRPDLPAAVDGVLARALAKRPAERFPDVAAFAAAFRAAIGGSTAAPQPGEPLLDVANPYKGLLAFSEADAVLFFGREALTQQLLARLAETGPHHRFLAVVGPSGSGKSSLVKAGLVPALRRGALSGADKWFVLDMVPGAHPFEELETALLRVAVNPPASLLAQLQDGERGLLRAVRRTLPPDDGSELVLIIDQFEELFTLVPDREVTARFLNGLITAVSDPHSPLRVIATLRADFYDRPLLHSGLSEVMQQRTEVVIPMTADELVRAIERPAARVGVAVQPELVAALVADVNDQPGALPLLQYTLSELFEGQAASRLTLDAYRALGGISGALAQRAEAVYDALDAAGWTAARALFSRLVTLGEGVEDTRRRVLLAELEALQVTSDELRMTSEEQAASNEQSLAGRSELVTRHSSLVTPLDAFGRARLLAFDRDPLTRGPTVEIAHEALLRAWPRLRGWLDEDRAALRLSRLLTAATAEWEAAGRAEGFLLRGARLDQLAPLAGGTVALTENERSLLAASLEARQARRAAEEARRQAELATARKLAETERQRADEQATHAGRLRQRAALLAGALALAVVLGVVALLLGRAANANAELARAEADVRATAEAVAEEQRDIAVAEEREALEAYSLSLAANARQALESGDQPLALLLALAANEIDNPPLTAWRTLLDVAYAPGAVRAYDAGSPVQAVDVSPDGGTLITGSDDGLLRVWDVASGELLQTLDGETDGIREVAFSPDGQTALAGSNDGSLILWDVASGAIRRRLPRQTLPISAIAFLPDGGHAMTGVDSDITAGVTVLWDLETGEVTRRYGDDVKERIQAVRSIAVDPAGRTALVGYANPILDIGPEGGYYTAILYDIESGEVALTLDAGDRSINGAAITPDGGLGLGASDNSTIFIWDLITGETLHILAGHEGVVNAIAVSADGRSAFSGGSDGVAIEWNLETGQIISRFTDPTGAITSVAYRDGATAVTGSLGGTATLWDLSGQWLAARWRDPLQPPGVGIQFLEISPDGRRAVSAPGVVNDLSLNYWFGQDTERMLERSLQLVLWDYETGTILRRYDVANVPGSKAAFTPDGKQVLLALEDATLGLFDLESGQMIKRLIGHESPVRTVIISADGHHALSGTTNELIYWDLATGQPLQNMNACFVLGYVNDAVFLPGDQMALANSEDGTIILWDLATGEQVRRYSGLTGNVGGHIAGAGQYTTRVNELAVTRDGRHFLSGGMDNDLLLWDTATAKSLRRFNGHGQGVFTVALTPDDRRALSGAGDETLILWDVATAEPIRRYTFPAYHGYNFVPSVAMHPDGETALVNDPGGSLVKWRLTEPAPAELMDWLARNRILRELTCAERETYRITPLCVNGQPAETTAGMLATARQATAGLVTDSQPAPADVEPLELHAPERTPKVAALGENRGELARGDFDVWTYEGKAGELLSIQMVADRPVTDWTLPLEERYAAGVLDTVIQVVVPDKTVSDNSNDDYATDGSRVSDAYMRAIRLRANGTYRIEARSAMDDQAGPYTLILKRLPDYWDQVLMEKTTGTYMHLPWNDTSQVFIFNGHLLNTFPGTFAAEEWLPISETEFFGELGNPYYIVRDENGVAVKFDVLETYEWNDGPYWYEVIRIGDLPPDFEVPVSALNRFK